ncbi:hypothetical protein [Cohnella sp. REN36]|uniref:hypothetical protein n=1 Tax=Cohnella sp. REN36 TaxID=2887347 RepID=UPI001D14DF96|nr:hypothetical protein [Cohnella sp. REN36]MCC3376077.1 hypothetical protein [Cohnella sp. REN36]
MEGKADGRGTDFGVFERGSPLQMNLIFSFGYGLSIWLGLYLLQRDVSNPRLRSVGLGLLGYGLGWGAAILSAYVSWAEGIAGLLFFSPWLSWLAVPLLSRRRSEAAEPGAKPPARLPVRPAFAVPALLAAGAAVWALADADGWTQPGPWLLAAAGWLPLAVGLLVREVRALGEAWLPDLVRSFDYTVLFTILFAGQVALAIGLGSGFTGRTALALLASIAVSVAFQIFWSPVRALLDRIAFATFPKLREDRSRLRVAETVQTRVDAAAEPEEMDEEELYRCTRRALSHFGDLQRLATNPLTQLKIVERRLRERGGSDEVLERAIELKALLAEAIARLKPQLEEEFGATEEWRYYNALYYPYVIGIKPYSVRYAADHLDGASREALDWFRSQVPERTCYNWQNAGARIIAQSLQEKNTAAFGEKIRLDRQIGTVWQ